MIGFVVFVLTIMVIGLGVLGVAAGLRRINSAEPPAGLPSTRLDQIETMLSSMESRLDDLQDQQRFLERLLEARPAPPSLGPGETDPDAGQAGPDAAGDDPPERSILFDTEPGEDR